MNAPIDHLVILAGGKGTRLSKEAGDLPKALVEVGGKPVLQHQLEWAAANGFRDVTVCAGYRAGSIREFAGDGSRFGLRLRLLVEEAPLGTAGKVLQSLDLLPEQFAVAYGDVMLAVNVQRMARQHAACCADFTAFVHPNDHPQDSDLVETDAEGWITAIHSKPHRDEEPPGNLVNGALYLVRREALRPWARLPGQADFVRDLMAGLLERGGRVLAYRSSEYLKDMGTPERLRAVEADWRAGRVQAVGQGEKRRAIFLELELLPGAAGALRALREAGYLLVILTTDVAAIHRRMEWELGKQGAYVDRIYMRKPAVGLFERAWRDLEIERAGSWMIGDQTRDIEMARRAGLRSILVKTGAAGQDGRFEVVPDLVATDLQAAATLVQASTLQSL